jgi:DNA primase
VIVVEGYLDVVALAQHGIGNAVATLGTATTGMHVQKLLRQAERIVFALTAMPPDARPRGGPWRTVLRR